MTAPNATPKILLVGGGDAARESVGDALRRENMSMEVVEARKNALRRHLGGEASGFDLLLLDTDLDGMDDFTLCRALRAKTSVPIVMLSARNDETSIVIGLEVGADDYLTKPFNMRELTSRIRAHLRRQRRNGRALKEDSMAFPGLNINLLRHQVQSNGTLVELSAAQFKILVLLASHPGRVYSREQIMEPIWGNGWSGGSRAADVHIQNIRKKIEPVPSNPYYLQTVRGVGYRFAEF